MSILLIASPLAVCLFLYLKINKSLQYWKVRNIPRLKPWNIFGILFGKISYTGLLEDICRQYSKHRVCAWFIKSVLTINDIDLIKRIFIKEFNKFFDHSDVLPKGIDQVWDNGFVARKGKDWHKAHTILSSALRNEKLKAMFQLMTHSAQRFLNYLQKHNCRLVTIETKNTFTKVTDNTIAFCIFGIACNSLTNPNNEIYQKLKRLYDFTSLNSLKYFRSYISPFLMKMLNVTLSGETGIKLFKRILAETVQFGKASGLVQKTVISDEDTLCQAAALSFADFYSNLFNDLVKELVTHTDVKLISEVDQILKACNSRITYDVLLDMKYLD